MTYNLTTTLESTSSLNFTGNIIPHAWYNRITFKDGSVDLIGIIILSDIVYWYRLVEIRDERTGQLICYKRKFKADMLQRGYESFAKQFGLSKRQVQDAIKRLEDAGLIIKELRTVHVGFTKLSNVLFLAP